MERQCLIIGRFLSIPILIKSNIHNKKKKRCGQHLVINRFSAILNESDDWLTFVYKNAEIVLVIYQQNQYISHLFCFVAVSTTTDWKSV